MWKAFLGIFYLTGYLFPIISYAEIKAPSAENTEITSGLPLRPGVGQNRATHASPTATVKFLARSTFCLLLFYFTVGSFLSLSLSLSKFSPYFLTALARGVNNAGVFRGKLHPLTGPKH